MKDYLLIGALSYIVTEKCNSCNNEFRTESITVDLNNKQFYLNGLKSLKNVINKKLEIVNIRNRCKKNQMLWEAQLGDHMVTIVQSKKFWSPNFGY